MRKVTPRQRLPRRGVTDHTDPAQTTPVARPGTRPSTVMPPPLAHGEAVETDYRRLVELALQDDVERERGIRALKVISGSPKLPFISLTFDDGPHGEKTLQLLDLL